jgi:hypothetical protein
MEGKPMRGNLLLALICLGFFCVAQETLASAEETKFCLNPQPKPNDVAPNKGVDFTPWSELGAQQKGMLINFFGNNLANASYLDLTVAEDGKAAAFLAVTNALSRVKFSPGTPNEISGLDIIEGIKEIRADRLILYLDVERIKTWLNSDLKYSIALNNKKKTFETGDIKVLDHTTASAALHCGYDYQWYTKAVKAPHLHWNVRLSDGQADVHLDGYSPWIDNFIPNPMHLTYANSDVRFWYPEYVKKYGEAGFNLVKRD